MKLVSPLWVIELMEPQPNETSSREKEKGETRISLFVKHCSLRPTVVHICLGFLKHVNRYIKSFSFCNGWNTGQVCISWQWSKWSIFIMSHRTSWPLWSRKNWIIIEPLAAIMMACTCLYSRTVSWWHSSSNMTTNTCTCLHLSNYFWAGWCFSVIKLKYPLNGALWLLILYH